MKKSTIQFMLILISIFVFQSYFQSIWAQSPQKMSYQAVVRNSSDQLVANKIVGMKISILNGSESGTAVYTETQKPTTNANGLVSIEIGGGSGFGAIDWANGSYFIKTETDPTGGTNYTISGVSQLLSVPYALHAKTVEIDKVDDADADPTNEIQVLSKTGNTVTLSKSGGSFTDAVDDADADPTNEIQTLSISGTSLTLSKGGQTVILPSSGGGDNWGTQTVVTNATLEGNGSTATPLKIAKQSATNGQVLKWNGTTWAPGDDAYGSSGLTLPYSQTVANNDFAFSVTNSLNSAIKGSSSSNTGMTYGVSGNSNSTNGIGVFGSNETLTGETYGVNGIASSPDGAGVYGKNNAPDGNSYGVKGISNSLTGTGVYGFSSASSGSNYGVKGSTISPDGIGVYGLNSSTSGSGIAVRGVSMSPAGYGVFGTGVSGGVYGYSESNLGYGVIGHGGFGGVYGYSDSNCGVIGEANSQTGAGVYGYSASGIGGYFSSISGLALKTTGEIQLTGIGEAPGKVLTSDDKGNATWQTSSSKLELPYYQTASTVDNAFWITNDQYTAIRGTSTVPSGSASGVSGVSESGGGFGIFGLNESASGMGVGVRGISSSPEGFGVYGTGDAVGVYGYSGSSCGVKGESSSSLGIGIYGVSSGSYGTGVWGKGEDDGVRGISSSSYGAGVRGWGVKYGVYGECTDTSGYAGYFTGRLSVSENVGIGVINPDPLYKLDVGGSINLNKNLTGGAIYCNGYEALGFDGDVFSWGYESQYNYFARPVAIGINDFTGYLLTVNGTAAKPGGGAWTTWSDIRLKDIQGNYEKGLKEIILLRPVKYNYKKDNECKLPSDINYVGFVAQEVQKIFPEAVAEGKDGYLTLDVNSINVALVNAIKELKAENDELNARLIKLEKLMEAANLK